MIPEIPQEALTLFLNALIALAEHQHIYFTWRPFLKDPKDDMVLELAVAASATHIVTFNVRDFRGVEQFGLSLATPGEILLQLGEI